MTRATNRLTAVQIKTAAPAKLQDGGGLILDKTATGGKWIYRYRFAGQRRVVMGKWADHVTGEAAKVVRLRG